MIISVFFLLTSLVLSVSVQHRQGYQK